MPASNLHEKSIKCNQDGLISDRSSIAAYLIRLLLGTTHYLLI